MSDKPLWYTPDEHPPHEDYPVQEPPTAARPQAPVERPPAAVQERTGSVAWVGGVAIVLVVAVVLVLLAISLGGSDDDDLALTETSSSPFSGVVTEQSKTAGSCRGADVTAPFDGLPSDISSQPASQTSRDFVGAHLLGVNGDVEIREVTGAGGTVLAGVVNSVDDPQVFANAFISGERDPLGPPPTETSLGGKQAAIVVLDAATQFSALITFVECRAVIVFGDDTTRMREIATALIGR